VTSHEQVVPTLFKAYEIATSGEPGPVFVEWPVNVLLLTDEIGELPQFKPLPAPRVEATSEIARAARSSRVPIAACRPSSATAPS
jgi:acetolactate synthase-1/2/3 large subunit